MIINLDLFHSYLIKNSKQLQRQGQKRVSGKNFSGIITLVILLLILSGANNAYAQKYNKTASKARLQTDLKVLASDSLGGREAGTAYEKMARDYIANSFEANNLKPFFGESYFQEFPFKDGADFSQSYIVFNENKFNSGRDFLPLSNSQNGVITGNMLKVGFGILSNNPPHNDYPNHNILEGKIFVIEMSVPQGTSNYEKYAETADLDKRIDLAVKFGAKAIILINNDPSFNDPRKMISNKKGRTTIPVIIAKGNLLKMLNQTDSAIISITVEIKKFDRIGYNVAGFLDMGASKTIIVGAHYDHLGMGGETSRSTEKAIHNGADDNGSGAVTVIELARLLKDKKLNTNILFISFSAEEKGLYGSSYFVENTIPQLKSNPMCYINFDMVGRMDSIKSNLTIFGTGTAKEWDTLMGLVSSGGINISKAPSGIGGSDQMPFYLDSIPVLFFFTGIHDDYHMPSDDEKLINYEGILKILDYSLELIQEIDKKTELTWKATNDRTGTSGRGNGGLSLGIMPDYSAEGGVLVNMVIEGKVGAKAGLQKGDVIKQIHKTPIKDIYDYMDAMKTCKPNQEYDIEIYRNGNLITLKVQF